MGRLLGDRTSDPFSIHCVSSISYIHIRQHAQTHSRLLPLPCHREGAFASWKGKPRQILAMFAKLLTCYSIHRTTTKVLKKYVTNSALLSLNYQLNHLTIVKSLQGGVTLVQVREKYADTGEVSQIIDI